eukprot:jgi/Picsp_1/3179/NSC_06019-R1_---NA---
MMTKLCIKIAVMLALVGAGSVTGQGLIGGNGLCANPNGAEPIVGGYTPVSQPSNDETVVAEAKASAAQYFANPDLQSGEDALIFSVCKPKSQEIENSVSVVAACSQVVAGTNYVIEYTIDVPCSAANAKKLPSGTTLTRILLTNAFVPLPSSGEDSFQLEQALMPTMDNFCGESGLAGGFSPVENASEDDDVTANAVLIAGQIYDDAISNSSLAVGKAFAICKPKEIDFLQSIQVVNACTQVVAGTNYKMVFTAEIPCSEENRQKLPNPNLILRQGFQGTVFVPLPNSNQDSNVTEALGIGGDLSIYSNDQVPLEADAAVGNANPGLVGGNGLCANPNGAEPIVGGYSPVEEASNDETVVEEAKKAAAEYLANTDLQSEEDIFIFSVCQPTAEDLENSVNVLAACSQVVAGTNYLIEYTIDVPCSKADAETIPQGTSLQRKLLTNAFVPLPSSGDNSTQFVQALIPDTEDFCGPEGLSGGFSFVKDANENEEVKKAGDLAALLFFRSMRGNSTSAVGSAFDACNPDEDEFMKSVAVSKACSQVVAGTNFRIVFTADIPCSAENRENLPDPNFILRQGFQSTVFVPLPDSNEIENVSELYNIGGDLRSYSNDQGPSEVDSPVEGALGSTGTMAPGEASSAIWLGSKKIQKHRLVDSMT